MSLRKNSWKNPRQSPRLLALGESQKDSRKKKHRTIFAGTCEETSGETLGDIAEKTSGIILERTPDGISRASLGQNPE